jgi:cardiolipin synthase
MPAPRALAARLAGRLAPGAAGRATEGNRLRLYASGAQFFPALLEAIGAARRSVELETYIFADDAVGHAVRDALLAAARRGLRVRLLVDGFGSGPYAARLAADCAAAGAQLRVYRPPRWWRSGRRSLRRLHRKIAVVDEQLAFVGGININEDPACDELTGEPIGARLDFAVACEGPVVAAVVTTVRRLWWAVGLAAWDELAEPAPRRQRPATPLAGGARAALALRDNLRHRHSIERAYLGALRGARSQVRIACAYFLPGRRMRRALLRAARRGVRVRLLLQGRVEYRLQHGAQRALYGELLAAGIEIHEYRPSYLHAKVAVVDEDWATVGSSNIDPISLLLAREANLVVRDRDFCRQLAGALDAAIAGDARRLDPRDFARRAWPRRLADWIAYALVRLLTVVLARGAGY